MTDTAVAVRQEQPQLTPFEVIERVITQGDLAKMNPQERVAFYWRTCESLGLNPLTRPFEFHNLNGKLVMYAKKDATDQLRKINAVSITSVRRDKDDELGLLTVYAAGRDKSGREDEATGVVSIKGLSGEALANATMKAETKAKRRLTLSLVGLGFLDESEIEGATADVDPTTGEIVERAKPKSLLESVRAQQEAMTAPDAPGAAEEGAQLPKSADEANAAAAPQDGDEAAWRDDPAVVDQDPEVAELTRDAFRALLDQASIATATVAATAKRLFPDATGMGDLSDADRAVLWSELEKAAAA